MKQIKAFLRGGNEASPPRARGEAEAEKEQSQTTNSNTEATTTDMYALQLMLLNGSCPWLPLGELFLCCRVSHTGSFLSQGPATCCKHAAGRSRCCRGAASSPGSLLLLLSDFYGADVRPRDSRHGPHLRPGVHREMVTAARREPDLPCHRHEVEAPRADTQPCTTNSHTGTLLYPPSLPPCPACLLISHSLHLLCV